jgi:hypothetical protein
MPLSFRKLLEVSHKSFGAIHRDCIICCTKRVSVCLLRFALHSCMAVDVESSVTTRAHTLASKSIPQRALYGVPIPQGANIAYASICTLP